MMDAISRTGTPPAANIWNRRSRSSARSTLHGAMGSAACSFCRRAEVSFDPSGEVRCDSAKDRRSDMFFSKDESKGLFCGSGILDIASQICFKAACCRRWYSIPATRTCLRALAWGRQAFLTSVAAISSSPSARCQASAVVQFFWQFSIRRDAAAPTESSSHPCICSSPRSSRSISATAWLMSNDLSVLPDGRRLGPTSSTDFGSINSTDQHCADTVTAVNTQEGVRNSAIGSRTAKGFARENRTIFLHKAASRSPPTRPNHWVLLEFILLGVSSSNCYDGAVRDCWVSCLY